MAVIRFVNDLREAETSDSVGTDKPTFLPKTKRMEYSMLLERSPTGGMSSNGGTFVVPPSTIPTEVSVFPTLTGTPGHSTLYTATLRRRKLTALAISFGKLIGLGTDVRFLLVVDDVIVKAEDMLREFATAQREGNTREILRTLRNCLRNAGWDRFRDSKITGQITRALEGLKGEEWLTPEHAKMFHGVVNSLGLDSLAIPVGNWPA